MDQVRVHVDQPSYHLDEFQFLRMSPIWIVLCHEFIPVFEWFRLILSHYMFNRIKINIMVFHGGHGLLT